MNHTFQGMNFPAVNYNSRKKATTELWKSFGSSSRGERDGITDIGIDDKPITKINILHDVQYDPII